MINIYLFIVIERPQFYEKIVFIAQSVIKWRIHKMFRRSWNKRVRKNKANAADAYACQTWDDWISNKNLNKIWAIECDKSTKYTLSFKIFIYFYI
jgi:hypothetical protein